LIELQEKLNEVDKISKEEENENLKEKVVIHLNELDF
jgi:hypothetical protein